MLELTWARKALQKEIFSSVSSVRALAALWCLGSGEVLDGGWEVGSSYAAAAVRLVRLCY